MQNYSQNNEQGIILNYFGDFVGTYLDLGANDGITLSNTYALYKNGWNGVCVEASPKAYQRLLENQPNSKCLEVAIGSYDGEIILNESGELLGNGDTSLVSSTKPEEMKRWSSLNMAFKPINVRCITFNTLLKETNITGIDFLSIDIEGMELDVLPQIDFNKLGTRLACIEFNGKDKNRYDEIMFPIGFKVIHQNSENLIYAK